MKLIAPITQRKIGTLDVLLFVTVFEMISTDYWSALGFVILTIAFWLGRTHFGGDFSLDQLYRLVLAEKQTPKEKAS